MKSCQKFLKSSLFFQFMTSLEQSGNWVPGAESVKLAFSLNPRLYFKKSESKTKNSLTALMQ